MQLTNNFNGGPNGAALSTSNTSQDGDNGFDLVQASTGSTLAFADASIAGLNRPTAAFVMNTATPGTGDTAYVAWTSGVGTQTAVWARIYLRWASFASTTANRMLLGIYSSFSAKATVLLQTAASPFTLQLQDSGSTLTTMATPLVAGVWNRVELSVNCTTSTAQLYLFADPNEDAPLANYTELITQSGNYGTSVNELFLGMAVSYNSVTPNCYYSALGINNTGFFGPAPFRPGAGYPGVLPTPIAVHSDVC